MLRGLLSQRRGRGRGRGRGSGQSFFPGVNETSEHLAEDFIFGGDKTKLPAAAALTITGHAPTFTVPAAIGLINFYGFETGDRSDEIENLIYTGTYSGINNHAIRRIGYGLQMDIGAGGNGTLRTGQVDGATLQHRTFNCSVLHSYFWFKLIAPPDAGEELEIFIARDGGGGNKFRVVVNSDNAILCYDNDNNDIYGGLGKVDFDQWYKFWVYSDSSSSGSFDISIRTQDNTPFAEPGPASCNTGGNYDYVILGTLTGTSGSPEWWFDDVSFYGAKQDLDRNLKVISLAPNAAGDLSEWTAGTGASNYTQIDEVPKSNSDYIQSTTAAGAKTHLVNLQSRADLGIGANTILGVKIWANIREDSSVTSATALALKTNGGIFWTPSVDHSTTDNNRFWVYPKNPITGAAWTAAEIDALQVGVTEFNAVATRANAIQAFVLVDENIRTSLPSKALTLTKNIPGATVTVNHRSSIPVASLTLTPRTPGATKTTASGNFCTVPLATLTVTPRTPGATKTEHNRSGLPLAAITLTPRTPGATVTTKHKITLPLVTLTMTPRTPGATVSTNHRSTMAAAALTLTGRTPGATVTTNHRCTMASAALTLTGRTPGASTTERHKITLPVAALTMTGRIPGATKTEHHRASIPAAALTLTGRIPGATVTTKHKSTMAAANLTITGLVPGATVGASHRSTLPAATLTTTPRTPQATTTQRHYVLIGPAALSLTGRTPGATVTTKHKITLPSAALTLTPRTPTATVFNLNNSTIPAAALTLTKRTPGATVTANNRSGLPVATLTITANAPGVVITENSFSAIPLAALTITAQTPGATRVDSAGLVLEWFPGVNRTVTLYPGKDRLNLGRGTDKNDTLTDGADRATLNKGKDRDVYF